MAAADFRDRLLKCLGGDWPVPSPLNVRVRERIVGNEFTIESVYYDAEPDDPIPALLLIPDGVTPARESSVGISSTEDTMRVVDVRLATSVPTWASLDSASTSPSARSGKSPIQTTGTPAALARSIPRSISGAAACMPSTRRAW